MEIILSKQCESLTGTLGRCYGYAIQRRTDLDGRTRFWGVRKSTGAVPADGHLNFIFTCAELAQAKLHIADIRVCAEELRDAFNEAHYYYSGRLANANAELIYNAREVLVFKRISKL